jgi:predicted  nucleic acid-binding Zn-ribbon protein
MKESEVVLNEVQAEIKKLEDDEKELQKEVVDVRHELERIEGIVKSNKLKVKHWRKEVGNKVKVTH